MRIAYNPLYKPDGKTKVGALTSAPINDIVFDLPGKSIWAKGLKFLGTDSLKIIIGSSSDTVAGTWTGQHSEIGRYEDGLTIIYIPKVAGASTTTLNINGLGAKTCYYSGNFKLTTHYPAGTPILFTYYNDGWRRADYDASTVNYRPIKINDTLLGNDNYILNFKSDSNISYVTTTTSNLTNLTIGINILNLKNNLGVSTIINNASTNDLLPTSKSVYDFVGTYLTSYMHWKGNTPSSGTTFTIPNTASVGDAYRIAVAGTIPAANSITGSAQIVEVGDIIICTDTTGPKYTVAQTNWTAVAGTSTLAWNSEVTLATIGGLAIKAKLPTNPTLALKSISFTKADGTAVSYNGSAIVDLTGGINYATLANLVRNNFIIKLNGGTTEGTNLFTYNGSAAKTINITPASIGAATSGHTHTTTIAASSDTNQIALVYGGKYKLTAGGTSYVFTMPASDNTWRPIGTGATDAAPGNHTHDGRYLRWNGSAADISAMGWGTLTSANGYTILSHAASSDGGDMGFVNKDGKIFMLLDGHYYLNEGRYRVLDTSDFTAFNNAGSLTTRITIGGVTKDLKIDADTIDGYHATSLVKFYLSPMTSGAPADSAKSWFVNTMPSASGAVVYNVPGSEKTIIAGKSSGSYGHMLQLNYDDNYLRILRYYSGAWKTTDWEKISAGYADSSTKWTTARTFTIGNTGKSVDGSANISWSLAEIGVSAAVHTHSVKINGATKTIAASGEAAVDLGNYLPLSGGTMSLGEGLKFHSSENYFGTNLDARIISLLDGNDTICDGGLIIDERATFNGTEHITELLRIRDSEFKWRGNVIWHAGNDGSGSGLDADMTDGLHVHSGRNNEANKIVRTDASGYILAGWINTLSGDMGTTAATRIYCSNDAYIRYKTLANFSSDIAGQLYWANVKVSTSSNAATSPTFGSLWINNSHFFKLSGTTFTCQGGTTFTLPSSSLNTGTALLWTTASDGSRDTGIFYNSSDFAFIANSNDHGAVFAVYDTDVTQDFEAGAREISVPGNGGALWARGGFSKSGSSNDYVLLGGGSHKLISDFATAGHTHDGRYLRYEGWWNDGSGQNINDSLGMNFTYISHGAPHHWGTTVTFEYERGSSYRLQLHGTGDNYLYFRNRSADYGGWHSSGWKQILTNLDTYVTSDGTNRGIINGSEVASARHLLINGVTWNSNWHWSGQEGQPSWLWGSNDGVNMYVWNPSNFSVNYANSAGNATTANRLAYTGLDNGVFTVAQTPNDFCGRSDWATYLIGNHGDGNTYYHQIIAMPFWGMPQYLRLEGGTLGAWYTFAMMGYANGGNFYADHFYENSDIRYKNNIKVRNINITDLASLPIFDYNWKDSDELSTGTSAQDVLKVLPTLVTEEEHLTLNYGVLGTIAGITACKELVNLKSEIDLLKDRIELLEQQLKMYHGNNK